jgi:hypothetical protein
MTEQIEPFPTGSRVVHIGPHKTGTTSLQESFKQCRDAMEEQRVHYTGTLRQPVDAVVAANKRSTQETPPNIEQWHALLEEMAASTADRVVISSEFFCDADDAAIRRIVEEVGRDRVQIMVTLRPLAKIIPSQWQQFVQSGARTPFDEWLHDVLDADSRAPLGMFWRRHRHDELVRRWAAAVGPDRVTVVVVDERDREGLRRTAERLLDLREGTLGSNVKHKNRSLTWPEVEMLRIFNVFFGRRKLPRGLYTSLISTGAAGFLKRPDPDPGSPRLTMPRWAADRAVEIAGQIRAGIEASGVRVIGDLESLSGRPSEVREGDAEPAMVPADAAARLAFGVLLHSGSPALSPRPKHSPAPETSEPASVADAADAIPTRELLRSLRRRGFGRPRRSQTSS